MGTRESGEILEDLEPTEAETADVKGGKAAFPDVVKSPSPSGPVPLPYPNQA
jgi:hypothetical protein